MVHDIYCMINFSKNKKLKEGLGIGVKKEVNSRIATLNNVKRIIKYTEVGMSYTKTDISKDLMFNSPVVEEIIDFLNRHTDIKFEMKSGRYVRTS